MDQERTTPAGQSATATSEATALRAVQSLGAVIGPTALVTGLLFYFGWARAQSQAQYLGLDVSLFGFSTQDYVLQSTYSVLFPLGLLLIGGLALLWLHSLVSGFVDRSPNLPVWPWAEGAAAAVGLIMFVIGLSANSDMHPSNTKVLLTPLFLTFGVGLTAYAVLVHRRRRSVKAGREGRPTVARGVPLLSVILVSMLIATGLVWMVANYAEIKGRELGRFLVSQLAYQPGVVVYSPKRLQIDAAGVVEKAYSEPDSAYAFRYSGLKLLFRSNGRYFLVPESWSLDGGATIVLPDSETLRLEFIRPAG